MQERLCAICGTPIPSNRQKYCSNACKRKAEYKRARERRNSPRTHRAPMHEVICPDCGKTVTVPIRSIRCPDCAAIARKDAAVKYRLRAVAGLSRPRGSTDTCTRCGKPYTVTNGSQRYCPECSPIARIENNRAKARRYDAIRRADPEYRERENARYRAQRPYTLTCVVCGKSFEANVSSVLCCSHECKTARNAEYQREYRKNHREAVREGYRRRNASIMADPVKRDERNRKERERRAKKKIDRQSEK